MSTRFEDQTDQQMVPFGVTDVVAGNYVELQRPIEIVADPILTIPGVTVETSSGTQLEGLNDMPAPPTNTVRLSCSSACRYIICCPACVPTSLQLHFFFVAKTS